MNNNTIPEKHTYAELIAMPIDERLDILCNRPESVDIADWRPTAAEKKKMILGLTARPVKCDLDILAGRLSFEAFRNLSYREQAAYLEAIQDKFQINMDQIRRHFMRDSTGAPKINAFMNRNLHGVKKFEKNAADMVNWDRFIRNSAKTDAINSAFSVIKPVFDEIVEEEIQKGVENVVNKIAELCNTQPDCNIADGENVVAAAATPSEQTTEPIASPVEPAEPVEEQSNEVQAADSTSDIPQTAAETAAPQIIKGHIVFQGFLKSIIELISSMIDSQKQCSVILRFNICNGEVNALNMQGTLKDVISIMTSVLNLAMECEIEINI